MNEIEIEITAERSVDRVRRCSPQERIAIGGCSRDHLGADISTSARAIAGLTALTAIEPSGAR
jgi:hypothetical protein